MENIEKVMPTAKEIDGVNVSGLNRALCGGEKGSGNIVDILKDVIEIKKIDMDAAKSKAVLCANFERRALAGEFKDFSEEQFKIARKMVYDGNVSTLANAGYAFDKKKFKEIAKIVFDVDKYNDAEKAAISNLDDIVKKMLKISIDGKSGRFAKSTMDYISCGSVIKNVKDFATKLSNDKAWMKIFGPMTAVLIGVTLLVQPLFGKIDKEFPEEKNGGNK